VVALCLAVNISCIFHLIASSATYKNYTDIKEELDNWAKTFMIATEKVWAVE